MASLLFHDINAVYSIANDPPYVLSIPPIFVMKHNMMFTLTSNVTNLFWSTITLITGFTCLAVFEKKAFVFMFGCPEFCPEFALCLLVTVALAREIVSCIKVVHVQYAFFGCWANVVWWVTIAREWMGHGDVIWTWTREFAWKRLQRCNGYVTIV